MRWSPISEHRLLDLDSRLRAIVEKVRDYRDISIWTTFRGQEEQNRMVREGLSKLEWPKSKHNRLPALAVDVAPYPYNEDTLREDLSYIAGLFVAFGDGKIRWGGDWDMDGETEDNIFDDLYHFELMEDG